MQTLIKINQQISPEPLYAVFVYVLMFSSGANDYGWPYALKTYHGTLF